MDRILIVDDEVEYVETVAEILGNSGFAVETSRTLDETMEKLGRAAPCLVALDIELQDGQEASGIKILRRIRERWSKAELPVVMVSGTANTEKYFAFMEAGANGFLAKPLDFKQLPDQLRAYLQPAREEARSGTRAWRSRFIGSSQAMLQLAENVYRLAQENADVLIMGESGTGKNLVVEAFRQVSPRRSAPFYMINCPVIPAELAESELFGTARGGHSMASEMKKGQVEMAQGGIILLDEIGELPLRLQPKLLTFLEHKTFTRVGSNELRNADVLILAATKRDLRAMVSEGSFRDDLYYRLCRHVIWVPPLRDHKEDIPELVAHFISEFNRKYQKQVQGADLEAQALLLAEDWDGNVRFLQHCIDDCVLHCRHRLIGTADIERFLRTSKVAAKTAASAPGAASWELGFKDFKDLVEKKNRRDYLLHHLRKHGWSVPATADAIGMSRQQLNQMLKTLRIQKESREADTAG